MVQRPTIPHFKPMVKKKFPEEQGRGSIKDLSRPFFLKSTLSTNSGRGKLVKLPGTCPSRIMMCNIRALKWGMYCLFSYIFWFSSVFYDLQEVEYNWIIVYIRKHGFLNSLFSSIQCVYSQEGGKPPAFSRTRGYLHSQKISTICPPSASTIVWDMTRQTL